MPGSHSSRRGSGSVGERIRHAFTWPRPAGVLIAVVGACAVVSSGIAFTPGTFPRTTATPGLPLSVSTSSPGSVKGQSDPSQTHHLLVAGAGATSPIQALFATGTVSVPESELWDVSNPQSTVVLVNKHHALMPTTFTPADLRTPNVRTDSPEPSLLRKDAAAGVEAMFAAAAADGVSITIQSSYRSYVTQISLYENYVEQKGQTEADKTSARPGYSEHQTGLALDIGDANVPADCEFTLCMAGSAAAKWVGAHGMEYGFIVRYPQGAEALTGYLYEPWHLRFVGISVALDMTVRGISSYEQYLGSPGAPSYK